MINHGKIVEDGPLDDITEKMAPYRFLVVDLAEPRNEIRYPFADVIKNDGTQVWIRFKKSEITASKLISDLCREYPVLDLSVREPDIEDMIREIYRSSKS